MGSSPRAGGMRKGASSSEAVLLQFVVLFSEDLSARGGDPDCSPKLHRGVGHCQKVP